jgi:hypothetical protein
MSKKHNDGLDDLFAGLPESTVTAQGPPIGPDDPLAELDELESLAERPKPAISRPETPRPAGPKRSSERSRTPGLGYGLPISARNSMDAPRSSVSSPVTAQPRKKSEVLFSPTEENSNSGWGWGSLWNTATTAVKAAEGVVKEIQKSEEGKKWVTQVKDNADVLRELGKCISANKLWSMILNSLC